MSGITLSAATRQNLLSLQDTANLLSTTQSRLSTGKKVNSALDNPTNFFTASALTARSSDLSSLLDGISNGVQTIQAANTGLTKLQSLTNQLKSTAQQALSSSNAFTAKATSTSTALPGATASNLLSTGATVAAGNNAVGTLTGTTPPTTAVPAAMTGSVDYKPTANPTKLTGAVYTPTVPTAATTGGTAFTGPANAVAGTLISGAYTELTTTGASLTITGAGAGVTVPPVTLAIGDDVAEAAAKIQDALTAAGSTVTVSGSTTGPNANRLVFTGATDGSQLSVTATSQTASQTGFTTGTAATSLGQSPAATQTLTINNQAITISGGNAGDAVGTVLANALTSINAHTATTGVTATGGLGAAAGTIQLTGNANGANFTASGSVGNSLGFAANAAPTTNGAPAASQTLTINGTAINIAAGATQSQAITLINAQTATTGVSASQDATNPNKIALTGKSDGSSFTVSSTNAASSGFSASPVTSSIAATLVGGAYAPTGTAATTTGTPFTLPANARAATTTAANFTAPANAVAATTTATSFTAPANAQAGTLTGNDIGSVLNTTTLSIVSGTGNAVNVSFSGGEDIDGVVTAINTQLGTSAPGYAGPRATADGNKVAFTGAANGDVLKVTGNSTALGFTTLEQSSSGQQAAGSTTFTFGANTVTVTGNAAGGATKTLTDVMNAINGQTNAVVNPTGVTASLTLGGGGLILTGKNDGTNFTLTGSAAASFATPATTNGTPASRQTLTINGTPITISGGGANDSLTTVTNAALAAINAQTATTGVSATAVNGSFVLSGANTGDSFTVSGSAGNTLGFASGPGTTIANGTPSGAQTLTINGTDIAIGAGATLNAAVLAINANTATTGVTATVDQATGHLALTGRADGTSFTVASSNPAASGFSGAATTVNGAAGAPQSVTINGTEIAIAGSASLDDAIKAINDQSKTTGVTASKDTTGGGNKLVLSGASDGTSFSVSGSAGNTLGLSTTASNVAGTLDPAATSLVTTLGFKADDNFSVNGQLVTIAKGDTIASLMQKVGVATNGAVSASYDQTTNKFSFTASDSGTAVNLADGSTATSKVSNLGFTTTSFAAGAGASGSASALSGKSLTVQVGSGSNISTTSITFGSAPGQISTLTQLNAALAPANAMATIDATTGKLSITTTNDYGAEALSVLASGTGNPFTTGNLSATVGGDGFNTRNGLVNSFNNLLTQIDQLAADSGFNGVNLLTGDNLKITFNEKGSSSLSVQGSAVTSASLGLSAIGSNTFMESSSINKLIDTINSATTTLKSQASSLGSNLAVVQNRQDFSKQLINILDTGAANLTNADLNEEAANSQALSTRNSIATSALSLANQAQQGVLQLLR